MWQWRVASCRTGSPSGEGLGIKLRLPKGASMMKNQDLYGAARIVLVGWVRVATGIGLARGAGVPIDTGVQTAQSAACALGRYLTAQPTPGK